MRIALCDDNYVQLQILEDAAQNCLHWLNEVLIVDTFTSADELLDSVNSGAEYAYVFLDIEMPGKSGFDVYRELALNKNTAIVFVSTHFELLPEAFELQPHGFLMKPYDQDTFDRTVKSVVAQRKEMQFFSCVLNGVEMAIPCNDIYYFEKDLHYLDMYLSGEVTDKFTLTRVTLDTVERQLSDCGFFRCHRSFLVNLRHCASRNGYDILFKSYCNLRPIQISRSKLKEYDKSLLLYKTGEGGRL